MAYSGAVKEQVLQLLRQGKGTKEVFLEINKKYKVGYGTIQKWKSEAGLTKKRKTSTSEPQEENKNEPASVESTDSIEVTMPKEETPALEEHVEVVILSGDETAKRRQEIIERWAKVQASGSLLERADILEEWVKLEPNYLFLLNNLTRIMIKIGRIDKAEEYQKRAEELNPQDKYVLGNKVDICMRQKNFEMAERLCKKTIQENKAASYEVLTLANIYYIQGKYDLAEEVLLQNSDRFIGRYVISRDLKLVEIYIKTGEYDKAEQLLQAVKIRDKDNKYISKINCELTWIEMHRGNFDKAREILETQDPKDDRIKIQHARFLIITGEYDKARQVLETLEGMQEKETILLARIEAMQGDAKKATELLDTSGLANKEYETMIIQRISFAYSTLKLVQREPGNKNLRRQLISIYKMAQDNNDILLQQLIQREYGTITEEMYLGLPNGEERQNTVEQRQVTRSEELDEVIQGNGDIARIEPENIEARKQIIRAAMQAGQTDYAEKMCYEILDLKSDEVFAYEVLLHIAKQRGNMQEVKDIESIMEDIYTADDTFDFDMDFDWSIPNLDIEVENAEDNESTEEISKHEPSNDTAEEVVIGVQISKEQLDELILQSKALQKAGKLEEARKIIEAQLEIMPNNELLLKRMYQIANEQGKWDDVVKYAQRRLQVNPNSIGTLKFLCFYARRQDELRKYQRMAREIIEREGIQPDEKEIRIFGLKEVANNKIVPRQVRVSLKSFVTPNNKRNDLISQYRTQIKQGDINAEQASKILAELEDDHSIRATALKAEIYLRVLSNPRGAKRLVEERSKREGTSSREKSSLAQITGIIRRAEKGIEPRELETIR